MSLQLSDNSWTLKLQGTFANTLNQHNLGIFNSPFVAILVTSEYAESLWRKGGYISQTILLPDDKIAFASQQELLLNKLSIFEFPILSGNSYELVYFPLPRLETVNVQVWEYQGETIESLLPELGEYLESSVQLNVDLSEVLTKLDNLDVVVDLTSIQAQLTDIETAISNLNMTSIDITQITAKLDEVRGDIQALNDALDNLSVTTIDKPQVLIRVLGLSVGQSKEVRFWEQPSITTALKIESIYIDSPADDKVKVQVVTLDGVKLTEREFNRAETPYAFPDLVLSQGLKLVFSLASSNPIDKIFVFCSQVPEPIAINV